MSGSFGNAYLPGLPPDERGRLYRRRVTNSLESASRVCVNIAFMLSRQLRQVAMLPASQLLSFKCHETTSQTNLCPELAEIEICAFSIEIDEIVQAIPGFVLLRASQKTRMHHQRPR